MRDGRYEGRPREKMQKYDPEKSSNLELIMATFGAGSGTADVTLISRDVRRPIAEKGSELMFDVILAAKGMGLAKRTKFMAAFKLWRRQFQVSARPIISSSEAAVAQLVDIRDKK